MSRSEFSVRQTTWQAAHDTLASVRRRVFIEEQHVPEALEWDAADATALHVLAEDASKQAIGCGRLLLQSASQNAPQRAIQSARIGRMAVLPAWRKRGVGSAMLQALIAAAQNAGLATIELHAQTQALAFYRRFGFVAHGDEFKEAGIPHYAMSRACQLG